MIWLQLRGGGSDGQHATYQPFNVIVLGLASLGMAISGAARDRAAFSLPGAPSSRDATARISR